MQSELFQLPGLTNKYEEKIEPETVDLGVWTILQEITSKYDWYDKVFNSEIVHKWRQETPLDAMDDFNLAIKLLQCTAQGVNLLPNCDWEEDTICNDCKYKFKRDIPANPEEFGLTPNDIGPDFFSEDNDWVSDLDLREHCDHSRCKCKAPDSTLENYVEYHSSGLIPQDLHQECKQVIADMVSKEPIDIHPGSESVHDLIHPSMYCYVKGVSKHKDGSTQPPCEENVRFQWLPSEFAITFNGDVSVESYINNLDADKYPRFIPLIQRLFHHFIPSLENVLHRNLRGRNLQVIVKVGSINLDETNPLYPGGSWHIEGMPHERIAATCLHYVDAENITESYLEFRKPVIVDDEGNLNYPQSDSNYTTHHYGLEPGSHHEGQMNRYLGLIKCSEGASVVFPNTLQHRVKEFCIDDDQKDSLRTIVAFFVIDPDNPIVSTKDIAPQQTVFTLQEAQHNRERLMFHRKFFVNQLNETVFMRSYSLCEH